MDDVIIRLLMSHRSKLVQVHHVLKQTLEALNLDESFVVKPIWEQWTQIVGPDIARRTEPLYVRGRTLIVACEHSTWMNELTHQKQALLHHHHHRQP